MVIIRSGAIAREVEPSGCRKIAAAPDNGRANEPWQWRLTVGDHSSAQVGANGQALELSDPETGRKRILELACEKSYVSGTMCSESFSSQTELVRDEGELAVVYINAGRLSFDHHTLGAGDAAIVSGDEHFQVNTIPLSDELDAALIRLTSTSGSGMVWVP
jgi:hypothetical protein